MKKILSLLLASTIACSAAACDFARGDDEIETTATEENADATTAPNEDLVQPESQGRYHKIETVGLGKQRYTIYTLDGGVALTEETDRPLTISMLGECVVDICIGMGTGIAIHKYYDVTNNRFSQEYSYVAAATEHLVAYIGGESLNERKLMICDIFEPSNASLYKAYSPDFSPAMHNPIIDARCSEDEAYIDVAYYTERNPIRVTESFSVRALETNQRDCLFYWSNGDGTCRVSRGGEGYDEIEKYDIPATSPFGERVTNIDTMCFYGCKTMKQVTIPGSVTSIGEGAFDGCGALESVIYRGDEKRWQMMKVEEILPSHVEIRYAPEQGIPEDQAILLARGYWADLMKDPSKKFTILATEKEVGGQSAYALALKWLVEVNGVASHYSTVEEIQINRVTGEILDPHKDPDGPSFSDYVPPVTEAGSFSSYDAIVQLYRNVVHDFARPSYGEEKESSLENRLGIVDETQKAWLRAIAYSGFTFYAGRGERGLPQYKLSCGYAVKDLNGDGIDELVLLTEEYDVVAIFSMANGKPVLLGHYIPRGSCWIGGDGLLHVIGSGGVDVSTHTVYHIANGGAALEEVIEFGLNGHEWIDGVAVVKYYRMVDGVKVAITESDYDVLIAQYGEYLGACAGKNVTRDYSGLQFVPLFTLEEIVRQTYEGVLSNGVKVYHVRYRYNTYLKDCPAPYTWTPLYQLQGQLSYAYCDLDGDGIEELIVDCGDTLILRYYEGKVYLYDFTFRNLYDLCTDGTYAWNHTGQNFEYGVMRLHFDGLACKSEEVYRIVNDGAPDAEYYIGKVQVTQAELKAYIASLSQTKVIYAPLDISDWTAAPVPPTGK